MGDAAAQLLDCSQSDDSMTPPSTHSRSSFHGISFRPGAGVCTGVSSRFAGAQL